MCGAVKDFTPQDFFLRHKQRKKEKKPSGYRKWGRKRANQSSNEIGISTGLTFSP